MSEPSPIPLPRCVVAFRVHLKNVECYNWEEKLFYCPGDIKLWMNADSPGNGYNNLVELLSSIYADDPGFPKMRAFQVANHLLVLAALLHPTVNCGNFIHFFVRRNLTDSILHQDLTNIYESIEEDLKTEGPPFPVNHTHQNYRAAICAFEKIRWAFYPASLKLHMNSVLPPELILPFVRGNLINKKGGTANVRHYKIREDLVECKDLRKALAPSEQKDGSLGGSYFEFAVKSYYTGWDDAYRLESEAFRGLWDQKGVVKYLGQYDFMGGGDTSPKHNIILEYGQQDLDEYLAEMYPPVSTTEIIAFWADLFGVARTLRGLHNLEYRGDDGKLNVWQGWHGDIKPDNILRVHGKFKLADLGFARFEKDKDWGAVTHLLGGTRTYGPPECYNRRSATSTPQTIDTWSFGCVLSSVATWVVLGSQAYDNYHQVRIREVQKLRHRSQDTTVESTPDDCFHDGTKVLPAVLNWHNYLRNSSRKCDTITHRILDLVEKKMLLEDPNERVSLKYVCEEWENIRLLALGSYQTQIEDGTLRKVARSTLETLLELDKTAPATAQPIAQTNSNRILGPSSRFPLSKDQPQIRIESQRVRKSERLEGIVFGKTANRQRTIQSDLGMDPSSPVSRNHYQATSSYKTKEGHLSTISDIYEDDVEHYGGSRFSLEGTRQSSKFSVSSIDNPNGFYAELGNEPARNASRKGKEIAGQYEDPRSNTYSAPNGAYPRGHDPSNNQETGERAENTGQENGEGLEIAQGHTWSPNPDTHSNSVPKPRDSKISLVERPFVERQGPYAIDQEWERLQSLWEEKKRAGSIFVALRSIPQDPWLKKFISNRDIIFVVDNSMSMRMHWAIATRVVETLAMKVGSLDKDGLDLRYTIGDDNNCQDIQGWKIPTTFNASMQKACREINERHKSNMKETLSKIFDGYKDVSKKMTLIILTDGLWKAGTPKDVEKLIEGFLLDLASRLKKWESRWFSIQFVSFGDDVAALERLQDLDDKMPTEDVIDVKPWFHENVDELVLGSITEGGDKGVAPSSLLSLPSPGPSRQSTSASFQPHHPSERRRSPKRNRLSSFFGK